MDREIPRGTLAGAVGWKGGCLCVAGFRVLGWLHNGRTLRLSHPAHLHYSQLGAPSPPAACYCHTHVGAPSPPAACYCHTHVGAPSPPAACYCLPLTLQGFHVGMPALKKMMPLGRGLRRLGG